MIVARLHRVAGVALALALAGCATQADIQDMELEQRRMRTQLADTRANLEAVQRDVAKLRGSIDEMRYSSRGRNVPGRLDQIEDRIRTLEGGRTPPSPAPESSNGSANVSVESAAPAPVPSATPAGPPREIAAADLTREEGREVPDEYRRGLTLLRQGSYDRAIQAFRDFLRTNRDSPLAPNAHYWIGESYYVLGDYYQAILNFNDVRQQWARSERAPAAILKIGLAFLQMGNKGEARLAFQKVVNDYPSSPEAAQARERLQGLGA